MFMTLTLGRCSILSLRFATPLGRQFPEPVAVNFAALLPGFDAKVPLGASERRLADAVLGRLFDQLIALDRPRLQTAEQEFPGLTLGRCPRGRHRFIRRDVDVLRMPHDERRIDLRARQMPHGLHTPMPYRSALVSGARLFLAFTNSLHPLFSGSSTAA